MSLRMLYFLNTFLLLCGIPHFILIRSTFTTHTSWSVNILSMVNKISELTGDQDFLSEGKVIKKYTENEEIKSTLDEIHEHCPNITHIYSIGNSVLGKPLWVLSLGDQPTEHEPGEPEVKLIANIHGNEPLGKELLINLAWLLCRSYGKHHFATLFLDHTQIHLLPSMNPDGYEVAVPGDEDGIMGRSNTNDIDLNRDFPDRFERSNWEKHKEPETVAVMNWTQQYPFVLSASIHGGALVVVYPFDGSANTTAYHAATPDDAVFQHLAILYSKAHGALYSGRAHCDPKAFPHGISNGNAWYPLFGGMQDWNYLNTGCMEITLELSCTKYPRAHQLQQYWDENKYPLIRFIAEVHRTLKGFVIDGSTELPVGNASIHVLGNSHVVYSTANWGEYWRMLPPDGQFTLWVTKTGYFNSDKVTINATLLPFVPQTGCEQLNFTLWPSVAADWSVELDFGIELNRRPAYFPQPSVSAAVRSTAFGDFVKLFRLASGGPASKVLGVEMTIAARGLKRPVTEPKLKVASDIHPLPGRARILLLAGMHGHDLVSTEMVIRMLRHYAVGLNLLDHHVSHLLSSQLVVLPYLDAVGIDRIATLARSSITLNDTIPGVCLMHELPIVNSSDLLESIQAPLTDLIRSFHPHLIVALTTCPGNMTSWTVRGTSFSAPISPIYAPKVAAPGVSMMDLLGDLAFEYADGFETFNRSASVCGPPVDHSHHDSSSSRHAAKQLADLLSSIYIEHRLDEIELPPVAMAIHMSSESCPVPSPQALPELWHRTLNGLTAMFQAVRNLSFRGRLLVESSPLTANYSVLPLLEAGWTAVSTARILAQPAFFFLSQSESKPDHARFLSVPVDPKSGLFCTLLPTGTFLAFAAAGAEDTVLGKAYEEVALAVSIRPDQNGGRLQIRLQRQVSKIEFHSPADMIERLRKLAGDSTASRCGQLRSIGKSALGEDLYAFEMGLNRTTLHPKSVEINSEENDEYGTLTPSDDTVLNGTQVFASLFPKVILFGNLDGSDLLTPQLLTHFLEWLCENRDNQTGVTRFLSTVQLVVIPIPNPDDLFTSWQTTFEETRWDLMDEEVCLASTGSKHGETRSWQHSPNVASGNRPMRLWSELINLTKARTLKPRHWWWEEPDAANLSRSLTPEIKSIVSWMRDYQPTAILSLPAVSSSPSIEYGLDLMEGDIARQWNSEAYEWLRFLGHLIAPGFHRHSTMCSDKADTRSLLSETGKRFRNHLLQETAGVDTNFPPLDSAQLMSLALSLASMSPRLALSELSTYQLQLSRSFPAPLPLIPPVSLALTLCPACRAASPMGIARVWSDFRLPSLLLGLLGHTSLTAQGSPGLIGQVVSTNGDPIPWVRVHVDFMRSEASSGCPDHKGYFSLSLPPGTYDLSFRAHGFLDHTESVKISVLRGPVHRVFRLRPVSALSLSTRIYVLSIAGSFAIICLCIATVWLCYRFCCLARTPYAMARRAFGLRPTNPASASKTAHLGEPNRGAYRLLPVSQSGEREQLQDETCKAMLSDHEDTESDVGEPDTTSDQNLSVQIRSGPNGNQQSLPKRLQMHLRKNRKARSSAEQPKKFTHSRFLDEGDDEGLEEVDLV